MFREGWLFLFLVYLELKYYCLVGFIKVYLGAVLSSEEPQFLISK